MSLLDHARVLWLRPDDVLVFQFPDRLSDFEKERLFSALRLVLGSDSRKIMVTDGNLAVSTQSLAGEIINYVAERKGLVIL